uniref:Rho-GAP domain-containing protein n=1 Tax=Brugia timori TaxID=42155 RepID=A0A0R3QMV7_9BILA
MKRRSVTFTDSPPEIIDSGSDCYNICSSLPTRNIFPWLQLAKFEGRGRRYTSESQRQWQKHHYSHSVPDLNKQHHYLSVEPKSVSAKSHFNNNKLNVFHQIQRMDPVYLSIPDFDIDVRPRPLLRTTFESIRNVTRMDTSWDSYGSCRKGRGEKHRSTTVIADTAVESPVKDITNTVTESCVKNNNSRSVDISNDIGICTDSDDKTVSSKQIIWQYRSSANDGINCNKSDVSTDLTVRYSCPVDNRNDSNNYIDDVDSDEVDVVKNNGRTNESNNNDYGKLAGQFLQRYYYHHLNNKKKSNSVSKIDRNRFSENVGFVSDISRQCYLLVNKPLKSMNYHRGHHSGDTRNMSFFFTSTANNSSNMTNIINKNQCYYYPSMIYSGTQQQLVDEMAKHIAECLEQFNTGLDKVLQARQLLETSQELPADDRETMLRLLNQAMRTSLKRMECNDDRYDPDGRHSESPNSLPGQRQCVPQLSSTSDGNANFHNITSNIDPAEFFQRHGQQLLALLQQNMAKQN